jgi:transcriptional accessory protein Tex/SPT6
MNNLSNKIRAYLGRTPDFREEIKLQDDGDGVPYIKEWNAKDKAKPTDSQLNALASEATKLNNNNEIRNTRKTAYGNIGDQLDEIYKDIDAWKARVKKIKDDNPKE